MKRIFITTIATVGLLLSSASFSAGLDTSALTVNVDATKGIFGGSGLLHDGGHIEGIFGGSGLRRSALRRLP